MNRFTVFVATAAIGFTTIGCEHKTTTEKKADITTNTPAGETKTTIDQKVETTPHGQTKTTTETTEAKP